MPAIGTVITVLTHWPLVHRCRRPQALPQAPQLLASLLMSTHLFVSWQNVLGSLQTT